jgi:hypothetical protein
MGCSSRGGARPQVQSPALLGPKQALMNLKDLNPYKIPHCSQQSENLRKLGEFTNTWKYNIFLCI